MLTHPYGQAAGLETLLWEGERLHSFSLLLFQAFHHFSLVSLLSFLPQLSQILAHEHTLQSAVGWVPEDYHQLPLPLGSIVTPTAAAEDRALPQILVSLPHAKRYLLYLLKHVGCTTSTLQQLYK